MLGSIEKIYEQSERLARVSVATIPDGTYAAESFMDDDGITFGKPIPIRVSVTVAGEQMTIDTSTSHVGFRCVVRRAAPN